MAGVVLAPQSAVKPSLKIQAVQSAKKSLATSMDFWRARFSARCVPTAPSHACVGKRNKEWLAFPRRSRLMCAHTTLSSSRRPTASDPASDLGVARITQGILPSGTYGQLKGVWYWRVPPSFVSAISIKPGQGQRFDFDGQDLECGHIRPRDCQDCILPYGYPFRVVRIHWRFARSSLVFTLTFPNTSAAT
jgi:hypothetical protein